MLNLSDHRAVSTAGMVARKMGDVGIGRRRDIASESQRRDKNPAFDLPAIVHIRDVFHQKIAAPHLNVVTLVA
jgi:hypothetical protein